MITDARSPATTPARHGILAVVTRLWRTRAPLTLFGLMMGAFTLFFAVGIVADGRIITGAPAWLKPTKFGISITLYTLTLTWMLGFVESHRRWVRRTLDAVTWIIIATFVIEMLAIVGQVVRGTTSHFNVATPLDATVYAFMSGAVVVLWTANFVLAGILLATRFEQPAFGWSLRLGLTITVIGMGLGFLMTSPTARQMASWQAGEAVTIVGAHSVGVRDGGPGMPLTGWSTEGGDLRIPHFVGMHALQVIPLFGWLVVRRRGWSVRQQTRIVMAASAGFLALVALVTWQALRGQSIVAPDALTVGAFAVVIVATSSAIALAATSPGPVHVEGSAR